MKVIIIILKGKSIFDLKVMLMPHFPVGLISVPKIKKSHTLGLGMAL